MVPQTLVTNLIKQCLQYFCTVYIHVYLFTASSPTVTGEVHLKLLTLNLGKI